MKTIYIDSAFKCHTTNPENTFRAVETDVFDGMCDEVIEGSRYIPPDESWEREDGNVFKGEMKFPWKDSDELDEAQRKYEREKLADAENALAILLGGGSE